jgi:hypothetical protein
VSDECEDCRYRTIGWKLDKATPQQLAIIEAVLAGGCCKNCLGVSEGRNDYVCCSYGHPVSPDFLCIDYEMDGGTPDTAEERQACSTCGGSGAVPQTVTNKTSGESFLKGSVGCPDCNGTGRA